MARSGSGRRSFPEQTTGNHARCVTADRRGTSVRISSLIDVQARRMTMASLDLIGSSANFRALPDNIDMVAPLNSAVLIQGEAGTGKRVIARAIHETSVRRKNSFVELNCATIPNTLPESELFGYENENTYLRNELRKEHNFEEILGNSPELLKLLDRVQCTAP